MFSIFKRRPRRTTLEEQLANLDLCGIRLRPGRTLDELLLSFGREVYEEDPYLPLLIMLGGEVETGEAAGERFSEDVWRFDTECIDDPGSYVRIAEGMRDLARGALPLEEIEDDVDIEAGRAWLRFRLDGRRHQWDATVNGDWVDPGILSRLAALLESRGGGRRFATVDTGGQDVVVLCMSDEEFKRFKQFTGLRAEWGV